MLLTTAICVLSLVLQGFAVPVSENRPRDARVSARADPTGRKVFAHYMLGLTSGQTADQWNKDISAAQSAGIDGFALNAGPSDSWTSEQLGLAFTAAESAGFYLFISFDMGCCGDWAVDAVTGYINNYKDSSAQFTVNSLPFVSTFEGPAWADNWATVRSNTGGIFLVPDWSSLGPDGVAAKIDLIDGAFSWDAWPAAGETQKTTVSDIAYMNDLGDKVYMMGVSPWFYTDLPAFSKNWNSDGDTLWYDRWEQVIDILPDYVEIITWNDYGESSYISEIITSTIVSGAEAYVEGFPHEAFRFVLPYYIAAYKAGTRDVSVPNEGAIAWYRTTPATACSDGGTVCGQGGSLSATACARDSVFVLTAASAATTITVNIGGAGQSFPIAAGMQLVELPFAGRNGAVTIDINGKTATGPEITNNCPATGHVNFNAVVVQTS